MSTLKNKKSTSASSNSRLLWIIFAALVIVAGLIFVYVTGNPQADAMPATINVQDASERFSEGAFLLDVRQQSEWNEAHVNGAVLIPLDQLSSRISELPNDQDILIICRSGNRSAQARDLLRAAGLARTTSISGGIGAWISAGLPVVSGP